MESTEHISLPDFENLFRAHYSELCAFAKSYLDDIEAAEEVVQDLFVRFWENRGHNPVKTSYRSYLFTAVKNTCINQLRHLKIKEEYKQYNQREREHNHHMADEELEASELDDRIRLAIDALPDGRKKIFILSRYEGLKYQEIADHLNLSIKTVENQMGEALKFLRHELRDFIVLILVLFNLFDDFG